MPARETIWTDGKINEMWKLLGKGEYTCKQIAKKLGFEGKKVTKPRKATPYGVTLELLASDPTLTKDQIISKLKQKKLYSESLNGAVNTGCAQFKKVYRLLSEAGHLSK